MRTWKYNYPKSDIKIPALNATVIDIQQETLIGYISSDIIKFLKK